MCAHAGVGTIARDAPRRRLRTLRAPWRRAVPERAARVQGTAAAYTNTKRSAQCCQTDALTYHVTGNITRGPNHGQTCPTPTLAAQWRRELQRGGSRVSERGGTGARVGDPSLAARASGPPRSRADELVGVDDDDERPQLDDDKLHDGDEQAYCTSTPRTQHEHASREPTARAHTARAHTAQTSAARAHTRARPASRFCSNPPGPRRDATRPGQAPPRRVTAQPRFPANARRPPPPRGELSRGPAAAPRSGRLRTPR